LRECATDHLYFDPDQIRNSVIKRKAVNKERAVKLELEKIFA